MSLAAALILREGDRQRLAELARLPSVPSGLDVPRVFRTAD
jgi:hypothetical protein